VLVRITKRREPKQRLPEARNRELSLSSASADEPKWVVIFPLRILAHAAAKRKNRVMKR